MITQELLDYIKQQLQKGVSKEKIENELLANGWEAKDVEEGFSFVLSSKNLPPKPTPSTPSISSLPGAVDILRESISLYKQGFGTFLGVAVFPVLIVTVLSFLFGVVLTFSLALSVLSIIIGIVFVVLTSISQIWGQVALLSVVKDSQEKIGIIEAYRRGWSKLFSYWWVLILIGLVVMVGFVLLFVPGLIFAVWFSLAGVVVVAEDPKGMNALLKSKEYVRGKWGSVLWRMFFIVFVFFLFQLVFSFILELLNIPPLTKFVEFIVSLITVPIFPIYYFLIYKNLKELKGDFAFEPSKKQERVLIALAFLGLLCWIIIVFFILPDILRRIFFLL